MATYSELKRSFIDINVVTGAREVIFKTVSCMCDNVHHLRFKKNAEGDFKIWGMGFHFSNWGIDTPKHELEWAADRGDWSCVKRLINSGTEVVESVTSR